MTNDYENQRIQTVCKPSTLTRHRTARGFSRSCLAEAVGIALALGVAIPAAAEPFACPNAALADIAAADSPDSDPCDNDGMINLLDGGTLNNVGALNNNDALTIFGGGRLTNTGTLNNSGVLSNGVDGVLSNYGTLNSTDRADAHIYNRGDITNFGTMNVDIGPFGDNRGTITNYGTLNSGYLCNSSGFLINRSGGVLNSSEVGCRGHESREFLNYGTANLGCGYYDGVMSNKSGGVLNIYGHLETEGFLENESGGTVNNNKNFGFFTADRCSTEVRSTIALTHSFPEADT